MRELVTQMSRMRRSWALGSALGQALGAVLLVICLTTLAGGQLASAQETITSTPSADEGQFAAGVLAYDQGRFDEAYEIWLPLAQNGNLTAQRNVGHMLRRGLGVAQNYNRAFRFYKKAARAGLVGAQVNLASMYAEGLGTKQSFKQAAYWFAKAAKAGHPHGQAFGG